MSFAYPPTHTAIVTPGVRQPLTTIQVPTVAPGPGEVVVRTHFTASTPLDLHQADSGLLISHPGILGSGNSGEIVAIHPEQPGHINLSVGDKVFGFSFATQKEKAHQSYVTVSSSMVGRIPDGVTEEEAVTVPTNLVTAIHTTVADLELSLPWPKPEGWEPEEGVKGAMVLVWGASSSVGMFELQVLRYWGYNNILAVASEKNHEQLREMGARGCVDYREENVVGKIKDIAISWGCGEVKYILDCIGSLEGSLAAISKIAEQGSKVAVMLPVIIRHAGHEEGPVYEMEVKECLKGEWKDGVELRGVRTHFYQKNEFFRDHLQHEIVPKLLELGAVKANKVRMVEGATMLERAEKALEIMRRNQVSGEKLVWALDQE